jgi:DNA (cytosine-5)-methyltransferase 1
VKTVIDGFCGAGGMSWGLAAAGFNVIGVDKEPQPNYPFRFIQADFLDFITDFSRRKAMFRDVVAFCVSPPCQFYSTLAVLQPTIEYPDLIPPTRQALLDVKPTLPFVIENVPNAPLINPITLCGSQFDSPWANWHGDTVCLKRHRGFESQGFELQERRARHYCQNYRCVTVAGHGRVGRGSDDYWAGPGYAALARKVMGIDWMTRDELCEAVPPVYGRFIGAQLMELM